MSERSERTMRLLLVGGDVADGRGGPRYRADVLVEEGRIAAIWRPDDGDASRAEELSEAAVERIDATGHVIAPGFIDMHAHSDLAVLADPDHAAKVAQGVTLEVVGQDGLGYAPVTEPVMEQVRRQIAGWNGDPDLDYSWRSVGDYLARVDEGSAVNVATLVPHGTVRMIVMGSTARSATSAELAEIREIVADGLRDGAMGLSTGLTYTPGMYASDEEIVDALTAVREQGGFYCPHHRNYGAQVVEAYRACLDVAGTAGVPLHLAHCHVNFPQNSGRAAEVLAAIDDAAAGGLDVTLDSYPYLAGATYLAALLPSWVHEEGPDAVLRLLADPDARCRILHEIEVDGSDGNHGVPVDWASIVVSSVRDPANDAAVGSTIAQLAERAGADPGETFVELLIADLAGTGCIVRAGNEENVREIMRHPAHTVGSDGILVGDRPHPRGWGTFPRFLGTYARDLGLMSMEEAIMHATSRPARRLGIEDPGVVDVGHPADLVVLDPERVGSDADYDHPTVPPTGIRDVFVDGIATLRDGRRTPHRPGRAVRRG